MDRHRLADDAVLGVPAEPAHRRRADDPREAPRHQHADFFDRPRRTRATPCRRPGAMGGKTRLSVSPSFPFTDSRRTSAS
ncbi:hypothetical protein F01_480014 [Burkholderia cenocepacia]|nr:hypothetical protein F01_480014 [Burkholderia cenocepacia]